MENAKIVTHAQGYLTKLCGGIDPISGNKIESGAAAEARTKRCFEFTAELLSRIALRLPDCEYGGRLHIPCSPNVKNETLIISRAADYMTLLSRCIDPVSGKPAEKTDVIKNSSLSRCFAYTAGLLKKTVLEKAPFFVEEDRLAEFPYSDLPLTPDEFTQKVNLLIDREHVAPLSPNRVTEYLASIQMIDKISAGSGNVYYSASKLGRLLGVLDADGKVGEVLFDRRMQDFIIKNLSTIAEKAAAVK